VTKPDVVVLDYGSGNIRSAQRALERAGADVLVTNDLNACAQAAGLVVPGVGAFGHCVAAIKNLGADRIIEKRLIAHQPVFGICVGMQMMFEIGLEGGNQTFGLGQWPGAVEKLDGPKLPHMGWNTVVAPPETLLFKDLSEASFYFVHSFAAKEIPLDTHSALKPPLISYTTYGSKFISAIENGPLTAVQFHPEKSGDSGIALLKNWIGQL
jgi:imidazole glycerol-phosphate synthase subunit HisH